MLSPTATFCPVWEAPPRARPVPVRMGMRADSSFSHDNNITVNDHGHISLLNLLDGWLKAEEWFKSDRCPNLFPKSGANVYPQHTLWELPFLSILTARIPIFNLLVKPQCISDLLFLSSVTQEAKHWFRPTGHLRFFFHQLWGYSLWATSFSYWCVWAFHLLGITGSVYKIIFLKTLFI